MHRQANAISLLTALILGFVFPLSLSAQITFERTYGSTDWDEGRAVQQTSDGNYIIAGCTYSFGVGSADVYLIKTDAKGDTLWTRTYGGTNIDWGHSVTQTSDGGYIIAGATKSFGESLDWDVYLIKTDANGDTLWTRIYGSMDNSELGYSVQQTSDSGYIIAGHTSTADNDINVYLIKTDGNGDTLWTRTYGNTADVRGYCAQQTSDGGYIIVGYTSSWDYVYVFLIKTDANGDTLWTRIYGSTQDDDVGRSVQQTSDGGYIIAGTTSSFGAGGTDVYLIKTDADGLVTGIEEEYCNNVPSKFLIAQNSPNPFNSETQIDFALPKEAHVSLEVYDVTGRIVKTLVDRKMGAGYHSVKWVAKDVPSGIYFYKIKTEAYTETKKIIVVR